MTGASILVLLLSQTSLQIVPIPVPNGEVGKAYCMPQEIRFEANQGAAPLNWTLEPGAALPDGLTLSPQGALCGVPEMVQTREFVVRVTDADGIYDTNSFVMQVTAEPLTVTSSVVQIYADTDVQSTLTVADSVGPVTWTLHPRSSLPAGISLSADGDLLGITSELGAFPVAVTAADTTGASVLHAFALVVVPNPNPNPPVDGGTGGAELRDRGGCTCTTPDVQVGLGMLMWLGLGALLVRRRRRLGGWLVLGVLLFAPVDAAAQQPARIQSGPLLAAEIGQPYDTQLLSTAPASASPVWLLQRGRLPAGLNLSPDGRIQGTPSQVGLFALVVELRVGVPGGPPQTDSDTFYLEVRDDGALTLDATPLPAGTVDAGYDEHIGATGGTASLEYRLVAGRLPEGLLMSADLNTQRLRIAGQPAAAGRWVILLKVRDTTGRTDTRPYLIEVRP